VRKFLVISLLILLLLFISSETMATDLTEIDKLQFSRIVRTPKIRIDNEGNGNYDDVLIGGARPTKKHNGIDILVEKNEFIYAPFDLEILRTDANPYSNFPALHGFEFQGLGLFNNIRIKIFYADSLLLRGHIARNGEPIAKAQDVTIKYPNTGMKKHIHVEMYYKGKLINPTQFFIK